MSVFSDKNSVFAPVPELLADLRMGKQIILLDDEDRENEGDLVMAAQFATAEHINFMAKYGRGLICLTLCESDAAKLDLPLMSQRNQSKHGTNFTVSIEAASGITTGISAADRAFTIQTAIADNVTKDNIVSPGHIFPLIARNGGVLTRTGHTEASVDLSRMAGLKSAGVICEIMNDDGTMARLPDLIPFAKHHGLKMGTIASLVEYRTQNEHLITLKQKTTLHVPYAGDFECRIYVNNIDGGEHIALIKGDISGGDDIWVRMHTLNTLTDIIGTHDDKYRLLEYALKMIHAQGSGVCVIMRDPRTGALSHALDNLHQVKTGGVFRSFGTGAQILRDLGVKNMVLLSNSSPDSMPALEGYGLCVTARMGIKDI